MSKRLAEFDLPTDFGPGRLSPFLERHGVELPLPIDLKNQLELGGENRIIQMQAVITLLEGLLNGAESARKAGRYRDAIDLYNKVLAEESKARDAANLASQARIGLDALVDRRRLSDFLADVDPAQWRRLLDPPRLALRDQIVANFEPAFRTPPGESPFKLTKQTIPDLPAATPVTFTNLLPGFDLCRPPRHIVLERDERLTRVREQLMSLLIRIPIVVPTGLAECHIHLGLLKDAQELLDLATRPEIWSSASQFDAYRLEVLGLFVILHQTGANLLRAGRDILNAEAELRAVVVADADGQFTLPPGAWPRTRPALAGALPEFEKLLDAINAWLASPGTPIELMDGDVPRFKLGTPAIRALIDIVAGTLDIARGRAAGGEGFQVAPVWRFDYLFQLASYFATQARGAEARAIEFRGQADTAGLTRQNLEDAVDLARADAELAGLRVEEAEGALTVARENRDLGRLRAANAQQRLAGFNAIAHESAVYQALSASLGAGSDGVWDNIQPHVERMRRAGRTQGERGHLIGANTYIVATMSADFERNNLAGQVREAGQAADVGLAQVAVEEVRVRYAQATRVAARLRHESARSYLSAFDQMAFTPDLLYRMSGLMQEIADGYFEHALDTALRMQAAFNYEFRTRLRAIDPGNRPRGVQGRLVSEQLIQAIDGFKARELEIGDRRTAVVNWDLPLHSLFPSAWAAFQRTGVFECALTPEMMDLAFPGLHNVSMLEARVTFRGVTSDFIRWSLTNSHVASIRLLLDQPDDGLVGAPVPDGDGLSKIGLRYQSVETLVGSKLADDPTGLRYFESRETRKRTLFESASPFCAWRLVVRPELNGLDLRKISAASLTIVLQGQHSDALAEARVEAVRAREQGQPLERTLALSLGQFAPNALNDIRAGRQAAFEVLPRFGAGDTSIQIVDDYEVDLALSGIGVVLSIAGRSDAAAAGVDLTIGVPSVAGDELTIATAAARTNGQGVARSTDIPALQALVGVGKLPLGGFTLKVGTTDGGTLSNGLAAAADVRDVGLVLRYTYRRGQLRK